MPELRTWVFEGRYTESLDAGSRFDIVRAHTRKQALALAGMQMISDNDWGRDRFEWRGLDVSETSFAEIYEVEIQILAEWNDLNGTSCPNCTSHVGRPNGNHIELDGAERQVHQCDACGYQWIPLDFAAWAASELTSEEIDAEIAVAWVEFLGAEGEE